MSPSATAVQLKELDLDLDACLLRPALRGSVNKDEMGVMKVKRQVWNHSSQKLYYAALLRHERWYILPVCFFPARLNTTLLPDYGQQTSCTPGTGQPSQAVVNSKRKESACLRSRITALLVRYRKHNQGQKFASSVCARQRQQK